MVMAELIEAQHFPFAIPVSSLDVTTDDKAERLLVIDRFTAQIIWHTQTQPGETISRILPAKYATDATLTCILLDDDLVEEAAILDAIKTDAKIINAPVPPV